MFIRILTAVCAFGFAITIDGTTLAQPAPPPTMKAKRPMPPAAKKGTPAAGKASRKPPVKHTSKPSALNIGELLARAAGYKVGLRTVDSVLLEGGSLNVDQLTTLVEELERLMSQRRDLLLYQRLVTGVDYDKLVRPLAFPRTTVALLGSRVVAEQERVANDGASDDALRERQLQALDQLLERLTRLNQKQ